MKNLVLIFEKKNLIILSFIAIISIIAVIVIKDINARPVVIMGAYQVEDLALNKYEESSLNPNANEGSEFSDKILTLDTFKHASVDGALRADENGELIIDRKLRQWIDFHLSAIGELSIEHIKILMNHEIALLPMPSRQQAQDIINRYLSYKEALADYDNEFHQVGPVDYLENLQQRYSWQKRLRREALPLETVEVFWQLDELVDDYALEQLVINNSDMTAEEKKEQLQKLDDGLPEELKKFRRDVYIASHLEQQVTKFREQGEGEEAIRQLRIEQVGIDAANRLEVLENQQNVWQQRLIDYKNEVKGISAIEGMTDQDKQARIKQYQESNFNHREQLRLDSAINLLREK